MKKNALGVFTVVTKESQAKEGLVYTLTAKKVSPEVVMVDLEIPLREKLQGLRSAQLQLGSGNGSPELAVRLDTSTSKEGVWTIHLQLSPALASKASIWLGPTLLSRPMLSHHYALQLSGYITERT